ncbi:unnamed protein product [Phytomonas sp. Hart1]|nr:unnamed protein product [Phytomonas sp. Hart1]|eukprot:CCW70550.1 unnamed protein product [Phytomonas sp. isolate Hart1]
MSDKYNQLMKLIIVGDSGTGKSSLLNRFVKDSFFEDQTQTIGVEFGSKVVELDNRKVKLQIWDTAGQERYRSVTRSYYRGSMGCLIVYDVTDRATYESVPIWLEDVRRLSEINVSIVLVGNKTDLINEKPRAVSYIEAASYAQKNDLTFFETSAVLGDLVPESFLNVTKKAIQYFKPSNTFDAINPVDISREVKGMRSACFC